MLLLNTTEWSWVCVSFPNPLPLSHPIAWLLFSPLPFAYSLSLASKKCLIGVLQVACTFQFADYIVSISGDCFRAGNVHSNSHCTLSRLGLLSRVMIVKSAVVRVGLSSLDLRLGFVPTARVSKADRWQHQCSLSRLPPSCLYTAALRKDRYSWSFTLVGVTTAALHSHCHHNSTSASTEPTESTEPTKCFKCSFQRGVAMLCTDCLLPCQPLCWE